MSSTGELLAATVPAAVAQGLSRLVEDWQLLADLSFADLVLVVPRADDEGFVVVAQIRPTTGPTAIHDDLVGSVVRTEDRPQLRLAMVGGRICREGEPVWRDGIPVREEAVPVRLAPGQPPVAVVARDSNLAAARTPSQLEIAYLRSAGDLAQMLAEGRWPDTRSVAADAPLGSRVGDGLIRLDAAGVVGFASPNALSAYRRLGHVGDLSGVSLAEVTAAIHRRHGALAGDEPVRVARGAQAADADLETPEATIALRSLPLRPGGNHIGALVLVHDVTEVRRHERRLISKDATIREIHHRVKNNLQTVAALLRLQSRRVGAPEARAALEESVRRVASIAMVHETLSGTIEDSVPFDDVADRLLDTVAEVGGAQVTVTRTGSFGVLAAEVATPLVMVVTELVHNAVEHAYGAGVPGVVDVVVERRGTELVVRVEDSGRGLPVDFALERSERLGLQIARTLVTTELAGTLAIEPRPGGGVRATVAMSTRGG